MNDAITRTLLPSRSLPTGRPSRLAWIEAGRDAGWTVADRWLPRLLGWSGRRAVPSDAVLCLHPCRAVHCLGMRMPIDVVFVDAAGVVTRVVEGLRPGRMAACRRAVATLELPAGQARLRGWEVGRPLWPATRVDGETAR